MRSYVDGHLCHEAFDLEEADLTLGHKLTIFGGGKAAQARGGDLRRVVLQRSTDIVPLGLGDAKSPILTETVAETVLVLSTQSPAFGGMAARIQRVYRGYRGRLAFEKLRGKAPQFKYVSS